MTYQFIDYDIQDGVAVLMLNRPEKLNSFTSVMLEEISAALKQAADNAEVRAVLLSGNGRAFGAGQDLSERDVKPGDPPPDLGESLDKRYNPIVRQLRGMEKPIVCAVNGVAAGAAANMALACDLVLAARSARFIQPFCRLGLVPDAGGTWSLPRLVGRARAMGMAMLGGDVSAEQAEQWGLIWKCVDDDRLMDEALGLAQTLATQPTLGLGLIKRAINESHGNSLDQQLDLERDLQRLACKTEDYAEGVNAFLGKRKPAFKGR